MTDSQSSDRLTLLEETVAHQTHTIEELSMELAAQWKVVDQLQHRIERLTEQFRALEDATMEAPAITRPPHF